MTLFPFRPSQISADIDWLTSVTKSYSTEYRSRLRAGPRLTLSLGFEFSEQQTRQALAIAELGDGVLSIPDWRFEQPISSGFSAAALAISVDASYFTPVAGDAVVVWQDEENFTQTTVASSVSGLITLSSGPALAYGAASIIPVYSAIMTTALAIATEKSSLTAGSMDLVVTDYSDFTSYFSGPTYGAEYVAPRDVLTTAQKGAVVMAQSRIDFGLGVIQPVRVRSVNDWFQSIQMAPKNKLELLEAEAIFHKLSGRLNPFWRPTWLPDFLLLADAPATQTYIRVALVADLTDIPAIAIERVDGSKEYFGIFSWSSTATYTQINFDAALAADLNMSDVVTISIMRLSRLDTDKITFQFDASGDAAADASVVGVAA